MNIKSHCKVGARFKLIAHNGDGVPIRESEWFDNLVLNTGLDRMSVGTWIDRCCVGTGNSTPTPAQTNLDSFVASTTTSQVNSIDTSDISSAPPYFAAKRTWRFDAGVAAGNISEVGMGWTDTDLWNRALIQDINGNPTTITVLSDEYLDVVSEIRVYPSETISGSFDLLDKNGAIVSTHSYIGMPWFSSATFAAGKIILASSSTFKPAEIYTGGIGNQITSAPSGAKQTFTTSNSYPSPRTVRSTLSLTLNDANITHKSFLTKYMGLLSTSSGSAGYKLEINPPITKAPTQTMRYVFEMSWGRYEST
ncbi:hypothetical protein [Acinetobacter sp. YH12045]|uniref:hypothetical protein n=1 Tax=Acinetobacter sp. YH12045 TaxID=2601051 RepID=UPI0015D10EAC|nr:hypothetical protein [Acinetobacter sp. YH12045]